MKYIKQFENIKDKQPKINDYVICEEDPNWNSTESLEKFVSDNIGQLIKYDDSFNRTERVYVIKYNNIPDELVDDFNYIQNCRAYYLKQIKHFAPNKKELKVLLTANKFNL